MAKIFLKSPLKSLLAFFLLNVEMTLAFQTKSYATALNALPEDLIVSCLIPTLEKLDPRSITAFILVNRYCHQIGLNLRANPKISLLLKDQHVSLLIVEAIALDKIANIETFNSTEAFLAFLQHVPLAELKNLWRDETLAAAQEDREPGYLLPIAHAKSLAIASFMATKKQTASTTTELSKLAYSLLFAMQTYEAAATDAALKASANTAAQPMMTKAPDHIAWKLAWKALWKASWTASSADEDFAAWTAARKTTWAKAWQPAWNTASIALTIEMSAPPLTRPCDISRFAYRVSEKVALLYFLKNTSQILEVSLAEAKKKLSDISEAQNIFLSQARWENFKNQFFRLASQEAMLFLSPWLSELDNLTMAIEHARNQSALP